jgi:hypothetical protein
VRRFEECTTIQAPADRIYAYVSDMTTHADWLAGTEGPTTVTKSAQIVEPSFLGRMMGWKLSKDIPAGLRRDLERIKARMEGTHSVAS